MYVNYPKYIGDFKIARRNCSCRKLDPYIIREVHYCAEGNREPKANRQVTVSQVGQLFSVYFVIREINSITTVHVIDINAANIKNRTSQISWT